ncbi:SRPBCC domain-containing protein [Sphingomonas sp.]|uniref:SRPBCC family protein n=1 Tax=Sphingomonas sp. TaxID=28214 RepID=UPI00286EAC22|nr:SRPBCC domain-containing protein [Sphingomonas sp.]
MALPDICHAIDIDTPRERVWAAMTTQGLVEQWLGCIGFAPEIGTVFYMQQNGERRAAGDVTGATHCELETLDSPERMEFTWFIPGTPKTRVTIELVETGPAATTVRLVHSGWEQFQAEDVRAIHAMLDGGWSSFVLPGLKRVAEQP